MEREPHTGARRGRFALAIVALGVVMAVGCTTPPSPGPDQVNTGPNGNMYARTDGYQCDGALHDLEVAQTFVPGRTGLLDRLSLVAQRWSPASQELVVQIQTTSEDGRPSGLALSSGSYDGADSPDFTTFIEVTLSQAAFVIAGQRYAIVITTPVAVIPSCPATTVYGWKIFGSDDTYPSGQVWQRGSISGSSIWNWPDGWANDLFFRTWVTP